MLVPHDYWIFENAELNSAFKCVLTGTKGAISWEPQFHIPILIIQEKS